MKQEAFFNISQTLVIGGCALLVVIITSIIHHLVGKIARWWSPTWGSLLFSIIIGVIVQIRFIEVLEPIHILVILANIGLIYLTAVGFNAAVGKSVEVLAEIGSTQKKGKTEGDHSSFIITSEETWRTRWFV